MGTDGIGIPIGGPESLSRDRLLRTAILYIITIIRLWIEK
jgi:hypothetical protein